MTLARGGLLLFAISLAACGELDESESASDSNLLAAQLAPVIEAPLPPVLLAAQLAPVAMAPLPPVLLGPPRQRYQVIFRDPGVQLATFCSIVQSFTVRGHSCHVEGTMMGTEYASTRIIFVCMNEDADKWATIAEAYRRTIRDDPHYAFLDAQTARILRLRVAEGQTGDSKEWVAPIRWKYVNSDNEWCGSDIAPDPASGSYSTVTCSRRPEAVQNDADVIWVGDCQEPSP